MINHIDVSVVLRGTVCDLYSNLVTRPTGAAVRAEIEQQLAEIGGRTLTVIDFTHVGLLDFSCADEIVAKLLLKYTDDGEAREREGYFLFRGLNDSHHDAIEAVLERHRLALVADGDDGPELLGAVDEPERRVWRALLETPRAAAPDVARSAGLPADETEALLDRLCRRRLVIRIASDVEDADRFLPVGLR